eukprot:TRINITY_DN3083_c0_g1_i3.p1 TRINITY_DN3083_c0_g1~~TRINITY_DN3083_c0_g1_i3.p1  ORF type:complete len:613 (-),score=233.59 TRINITY_DN3083_c0_g1_i3:255-2009(-)
MDAAGAIFFHVPNYKFPSARNFDFKKLFNKKVPCMPLITEMTEKRELLVSQLRSDPDCRNVSACAEEYLPYLLSFVKCLQSQEQKKQFLFEWSSIMAQDNKKVYKTDMLLCEVGSMAILYAIAQINKTHESFFGLDQSGILAAAPAASKSLRVAAGLLVRVKVMMESLSAADVKYHVRPVEYTSGGIEAMSDFLLCLSQQLIIGKAICEKKPDSLTIRLLGSLGSRYNALICRLRTQVSNEEFNTISPSFIHHFMAYEMMAEGTANRMLANSEYEATKIGSALGYARMGVQKYSSIPHLHSSFEVLHQAIACENQRVHELFTKIEKDNNIIYFEEEVAPPRLFNELFIVKPDPFEFTEMTFEFATPKEEVAEAPVEEEEAPEVGADQWKCDKCTLVNPNSADRCAVCNNEKPVDTAALAAASAAGVGGATAAMADMSVAPAASAATNMGANAAGSSMPTLGSGSAYQMPPSSSAAPTMTQAPPQPQQPTQPTMQMPTLQVPPKQQPQQQPQQQQQQGTVTVACAFCRKSMAAPVGAPKIMCPYCRNVTLQIGCGHCKTPVTIVAGTCRHFICPGCKQVNMVPNL